MHNNQNAENAVMVLVATYYFTNDSNIDKKIAQLTLENISRIPNMTVEQIANCCGVSISSYLRFCRRMGFSSYTQFKIRITGALQKYLFIGATPVPEQFSPDNFFDFHRTSIENDFSMLEKNLDTAICEKLVDSLAEAKNIFIIDMFYSLIRFSLHGDLSICGKRVTYIPPSDELYAIFQKEMDNHSLMLFVNDGTCRTQDYCPLIPLCKQAGAHVAVLSNTRSFQNINDCDEVLFMGTATSSISSVMIHDLTLQYLSALFREKYMVERTLFPPQT